MMNPQTGVRNRQRPEDRYNDMEGVLNRVRDLKLVEKSSHMRVYFSDG